MTFNRIALLAASLVLLTTVGNAMQATTTRSVNSGVYTEDQGARGEQVFKNNCSSCHYQAEFSGDDFVGRWADKPLFELFSMISDSMPEDRPGTLPPQQYGDVVAYFLKLNKFPLGATELEGSAEAMRDILMEKMK
jgi:mono/diheme cytochrome c family protein